MVTQLAFKELLDIAIQKEIASQKIYTRLEEAVSEPSVKNAFLELVSQEKGHQEILEKYRNGELKAGALSHAEIIDYRIAEKLEQPEMSPGMSLPDVFLLAANREKASHEFYLALAALHPEGEVKRLLGELAEQELAHKQRVEFLYTEVAFPQTDGG